jgi:site-specific recombinase XerD
MSGQAAVLSGFHITVDTSLMDALEGWKLFLKDKDRSEHTIKAFAGDLQLFISHNPSNSTVGSVTTKEINDFLHWLQHERGTPCSPKSLSRRITSIKSFFRWLNRGGVVLSDPAERVLQQSAVSRFPDVLPPEETALALEAAAKWQTSSKPDARPYALLSLLLCTGIKKGECLALKQNHVDLEAPEGPQIFVRYANPANRYKERKISVPSDWVHVYKEYLAQYQPADEIFPWSPRRLEYLLEDIGKAAGLQKHISFDMCRWTCALTDWQSGMEKDKVRQKLGISKIQWREISFKLGRLAGDPESEEKSVQPAGSGL